MTLVFLGFCAKRIWIPTGEWTESWGGQVQEIASVSDCLSERIPDWVDRWDFNRATCWDDEAAAISTVPAGRAADFRVFGYRLLPAVFDKSAGSRSVSIDDLFPASLPDLPVEHDLSRYRRIGYDIVELAGPPRLGFGCSPLSCNGMAKTVPVNRFCLIDDLDSASLNAKRFGSERPEPGPYVIIEVQWAGPDLRIVTQDR